MIVTSGATRGANRPILKAAVRTECEDGPASASLHLH
jgi:hypothetical protein